MRLALPCRGETVKKLSTAVEKTERFAIVLPVPGPIFSATGRFSNCIRISCGYRWSDVIDRALLTLGRLAGEAGS